MVAKDRHWSSSGGAGRFDSKCYSSGRLPCLAFHRLRPVVISIKKELQCVGD